MKTVLNDCSMKESRHPARSLPIWVGLGLDMCSPNSFVQLANSRNSVKLKWSSRYRAEYLLRLWKGLQVSFCDFEKEVNHF